MRYTLDSMLPEKAFSPRLGRGFGAGGMTFEGGSGGGSSAPAPAAPTQTTVQNTNIPDYLRPYAETMLGATQQQLFNTQAQTPTYDASGNQTNTGAVDITGVKPYVPYSSNPADYVAGFSPMQQAAQEGAANLQVPGQYGQASNMAGASGLGALGTVGGAGMYGSMGARAGQQGAALSNAYGGMGAMQGQQGAQIGQSLGQQSQNTSQGPGSVASYMNPYLQNSLNPQLQLANQQYGIAGQQQQGAATSAGAFGGSRSALANSLNQQNQMLAQNQIIGQGYNQAFSNAQNQMNTANQAALAGNQQALSGYGMGLQGANQAGTLGLQGAQAGLAGVGAQQAGYNLANTAASNLANIGGQQLGAQQNIIAAQSQAGQQQQTQQQNIINQAIQNYATAQQYPQQQLSFMNSMLRGLPTQQTTTATYQAAPSTVNQITGLGLAGLGAYNAFGGGAAAGSDINLKENVVLLWRADNGMGIYEFEYKPEFKDHALCGHGKFIGYVAQEVEKFMPEAVFTMDNGYKAVDYNLVRGAA